MVHLCFYLFCVDYFTEERLVSKGRVFYFSRLKVWFSRVAVSCDFHVKKICFTCKLHNFSRATDSLSRAKKKIVHVTFFGVSRVPFAKFGHGLLSMSRVKISEIGHAHCHGLLWGLILSRVTSRVTRYFLGFGHGLLKKCHVEKNKHCPTPPHPTPSNSSFYL